MQGSEIRASWESSRNKNDRKGQFSRSVEGKVLAVGDGARTGLGPGPRHPGQHKRFGFCSQWSASNLFYKKVFIFTFSKNAFLLIHGIFKMVINFYLFV